MATKNGYAVSRSGKRIAAFRTQKALQAFVQSQADAASLVVEHRYINHNSVIVWEGASESMVCLLCSFSRGSLRTTKPTKAQRKMRRLA